MKTSRIAVPVIVVLAALVAPSSWVAGEGPAFASGGAASSVSADEPRESVTVTGRGEAFGKPDVLTAHFGVEVSASTVGEALDRANTAATRMRDALVRAGMSRADLQTSNASINSTRDDNQKITGYTASQGLTATIRNLSQAGTLMSAAIAAGGDAARLNGVSFAVEDDSALLAEARKSAFADAREKAELYAREAGRPLGRVIRVSEESPRFGEPVERYNMVADSAGPIEPGRQQLTAAVTVEWALG